VKGDTVTTPEKLRRRQRIEGTGLVVFAIFSTAAMFYLDSRHDKEIEEQRACTIETVSDIVDVIESGRAAYRIEQEATQVLITSALDGRLNSEEAVGRAQAEYAARVLEAKNLRAESPLPPDPEKVCR
jgi:hypothetical protein